MHTCPLCDTATPATTLAEAGWLAPDVQARLAQENPGWRAARGACPACVQRALLHILLEQGDAALHAAVQSVWPLDAEAAFGALPTPLRLHADPHYTGQGVTLALVDSAFYPHPDLIQPRNRIRAWADAGTETVRALYFTSADVPQWPRWGAGAPEQWHGLMTSVVAAGGGHLSHGLYCGLASGADLALVQAREPDGHISNRSITRALDWLRAHGPGLGVRVVNLSLGGDPVTPLAGNPVDEAVAGLVAQGVTVVVAAGNSGERRLVPPATAPDALTVGGLDDHSAFDHADVMLWHSNYGESGTAMPKPELVAPSLWVAAPVLPGTALAAEARSLFARRAQGDRSVEGRIAALKLVTPFYQHVDGTSFAAPLVASAAACLLQANPLLTPQQVRDILIATAQLVPGVSRARQGAGALNAGAAVAAGRDLLLTAEGLRP